MRSKIYTFGLLLSAIMFLNVTAASAQVDDPVQEFKKYINDMVVKVEHTDEPEAKRAIINNTFDELLSAFDQVEELKGLSGKEQEALNLLTEDITDKKNELNGRAGYKIVPDNQLNQYAKYVQQDMEQAETITISIVVALLIVIILLLI
ncbi:MAG TPA: hypothetical protein VK106_06705 [Balneolaceae bacterium]|nr:hypothetical protein [Balneolaceae bacterium]